MAVGVDYLETLRSEVIASAQRNGVRARVAMMIADAVEERIRTEYGTAYVYIHAPSKEVRDRRILEEFNYRNHADICKKFGISMKTLFRILKKNRLKTHRGLSNK